MLERGRKRKPTAILKLSGSRCAKGRDDPPGTIITELPDPPEHLNQAARDNWIRVGTNLVKMGILAVSDLDVLADYSVAYAQAVDCMRMVNEQGVVIDSEWGPRINPAYFAQEKALSRVDRLGTYLGMNPSARSKVKPVVKKKDASEKKKFFNAGGA